MKYTHELGFNNKPPSQESRLTLKMYENLARQLQFVWQTYSAAGDTTRIFSWTESALCCVVIG